MENIRQLNEQMRQLQQSLASLSGILGNSLNSLITFSMQAFSSIDFDWRRLWDENELYGNALGMGMSYGLGQVGGGIMNLQQDLFRSQRDMYRQMGQGLFSMWKSNDNINRWWPKWSEVFVPGYGNYGGPFRTDPSFKIRPIDSMDTLFMQHDIGWARGQGRIADKLILNKLYSLPSNPIYWNEPPAHSWKATAYRRFVAEPYFWWRNLSLENTNNE